MSTFSIVICTYKPHPKIFFRLLNAILKFDPSSIQHEVIIVDNNTSPPLEQNDVVKSFLSIKQNASIITEKRPGLTNARIAGIKAAKAGWLIFFDDDNEPAEDYLMEAKKLIDQYMDVGAWGPGNIIVNFIEQKENSYLNNLKPLFQQRMISSICFDNNKVEGNECYPNGTGLIIRREILEVYIHEVEKNILTMTDRMGNSLSSGGDTQMLYIALRMGFFAGAAPSLGLTHHIVPDKTKLTKVLNLIYSMNAGQVKAYNEVFPTHPYVLKNVGNNMLLKSIMIFIKRVLKRPLGFRKELLDLSRNFGMHKAQVFASNQDNPLLLNFWESIIRY